MSSVKSLLNVPFSSPDWLLYITTPTAPALTAFTVFIANVHSGPSVPRLMSAMFPAGKPAKSAGTHPNIPDGTLTGAVTLPLPE